MTRNITPLESIRKKCVDCCAGMLIEIKACPSINCSLWKFRLGLHPFTQKNKNNPFLDETNFVKNSQLDSSKFIKIVSGDVNE